MRAESWESEGKESLRAAEGGYPKRMESAQCQWGMGRLETEGKVEEGQGRMSKKVQEKGGECERVDGGEVGSEKGGARGEKYRRVWYGNEATERSKLRRG